MMGQTSHPKRTSMNIFMIYKIYSANCYSPFRSDSVVILGVVSQGPHQQHLKAHDDILTTLETSAHERRAQWDRLRAADIMHDEVRALEARIDIVKIKELDKREATYACSKTRTPLQNPKKKFNYVNDPDGRLERIDVGECVRSSTEFLAELRKGGFGYVYVTREREGQPSVVNKVFSPRIRNGVAHDYLHLSKLKYSPYFVTVVPRSLSELAHGGALFECFAMVYDAVLKTLEVRRRQLPQDRWSDPETAQDYMVALADIAMGLHFMHAARLITATSK